MKDRVKKKGCFKVCKKKQKRRTKIQPINNVVGLNKRIERKKVPSTFC